MQARAVFAVLALAPLCGCERREPAPAQPASVAPAAPAAESAESLYARAWEGMSRDLRSAAASVEISPEGPRTYAEAPITDYAEVERILEAHQPVIGLLLEASSRPEAAFTGERQAVRDAARILRADAWRLWKSGDLDGAARRLEAIYGLCHQLTASRDPLLVLVNMAVLALAHESVRDMGRADPAFSTAHADRLLEALNRFDADDPIGILAAQDSTLDPERTESLRAKAAGDLAVAKDSLSQIADNPD